MCTAVKYKSKNLYFGRNLDLERGYGEGVVITPRRFEIVTRHEGVLESHFAMIGMAAVVGGYPLYFEATNEKGLSMAGLNFPENAVYFEKKEEKKNIAPFEFIPFVLGKCKSTKEAEGLIKEINLVNENFSEELPLSPLHWMISDKDKSIVVESVLGGLKIYDNPFEVLTNNPPFDYHKTNIKNYMGLSVGGVQNKLCPEIPLENYSLGMGAMGLPGDFSSASRFIRAVFVKEKSVAKPNEKAGVNQFFHILDSVSMPRGCVAANGNFEYTRYSSCCNADTGVYYYKTYDDFEVRSVDMKKVDLDTAKLFVYTVSGM